MQVKNNFSIMNQTFFITVSTAQVYIFRMYMTSMVKNRVVIQNALAME